MYETFYGFREKPFSLVPDPDFLYLGKHHRAALNILEYGLRGEASFALISGEVGSGKTILIRRFLRMVDQHTTVGLITNTHASLGNLLDWILLAFDLDYRGKEKVELFEILTDFVRGQQARGRRTVLIIDEAQNMDREMLEELRMLSNINVDKHLMFQIVLAGQPEILDKINKPELRQLAQRISANFHLSPLTLDETRDYICHRLAVAGGRREIFDNLACAAVYYFTEGLPRPINIVCDAALVYGFGEGRETIGLETILDVVENVQRSGLKALRALDKDFDREALTREITALAGTYLRSVPPEEDLGALEALSAGRAHRAPAGSEENEAGQRVRPQPVGSAQSGPELRPTRDVPVGIPPLINDGASDDWQVGADGAAATKKKKWRRLFDAAAASLLLLVAAASLVRGLGTWFEPPAAETVTAEQVVKPAEQSIVPQKGPDSGAPASQETAGEDQGLAERLLSALSWNSEDTATADRRPSENSSTSVTIPLEVPGDADRQAAGPGEQGVEATQADQMEPTAAQAPQPLETPEDGQPAGQSEGSAAKPIQTAAIPTSPASALYTHWVRLGTFRHEDSAPTMWRRLRRDNADLLGGLSYQIKKVEGSAQGALYLLKAGPLADAEASRALCRALVERGVDCLASSTQSEVAAVPQTNSTTTQAGDAQAATPAPGGSASKNAYLYKMALAHSQDGQTYARNGDYDKAIQEFDDAIRLNPELAAAHYSRGEIYFQRGDYPRAIQDFTETIDLAPDYTFAYYSRGVANEKAGNIEEAILDFSQTVRLKPGYAPAYNDRARAFYNLGHLREALRDSELAISVAPDTPSYLATHSQILAALGRNEGAFATMEKAMAVANSDWIKKSQQAMSRDGYYRGPIDGRYGPATKSAMRACLVSGCNVVDWN